MGLSEMLMVRVMAGLIVVKVLIIRIVTLWIVVLTELLQLLRTAVRKCGICGKLRSLKIYRMMKGAF